MGGLTECKYCGCSDVLTSSEAFVHFGCGSGYWPGADQWTYANKCVGKCAARVAELEERVQRAVEVLKAATRYRVTPVSAGYVEWDTDEDGPVTDSAAVDEALAILEGERDETT